MKKIIWMVVTTIYLLNVKSHKIESDVERPEVILTFSQNSTQIISCIKTCMDVNVSLLGSKNLQIQSTNENQKIEFEVKGIKLAQSNEETFVKINEIISLNLSSNSIKYIKVGIFDHFSELKNLNLSKNIIETLQKTFFLNLTKLEIVDLSHNSIKMISPAIFAPLHSLKLLNLSNNVLTNNVIISFTSYSLDSLNVYGNLIFSLEIEYDIHEYQQQRCATLVSDILKVIGKFDDDDDKTQNDMENKEAEEIKIYKNDKNQFKLMNKSHEFNRLVMSQIADVLTSTLATPAVVVGGGAGQNNNFNKNFWRIDQNMTDLIRITKQLHTKTNKIMLDMAWMKIGNIISNILVASCVVPVLVILWRTKYQVA